MFCLKAVRVSSLAGLLRLIRLGYVAERFDLQQAGFERSECNVFGLTLAMHANREGLASPFPRRQRRKPFTSGLR